MQSPPRRRPPPGLQPRFTLFILYFAAFFIGFAVLLILPELLHVLETVPTGPEQERIAEEVAREAARPRLLAAFLLATACVAAGAYYQVLPGTRNR